MPVETAADRLAFLDADEFAIEAIYRRRYAFPADSAVTGIFDAEFAVANAGENGVVTTAPAFVTRTADLPEGGIPEDLIVVTEAALTAAALPSHHAGEYMIRIVAPDGTGMTVLYLERQT